MIGAHAWMLRFFADDAAGSGDRLLLVNLGTDLTLAPMPEPLLAPLEDQAWQILWSSEQPAYGGGGTPPLVSRRRPAHRRRERARAEPGPLTPEAAPELSPINRPTEFPGDAMTNEVIRVSRDENPRSRTRSTNGS